MCTADRSTCLSLFFYFFLLNKCKQSCERKRHLQFRRSLAGVQAGGIQLDPEADTPVLRLDEKNLSWREVARVQLWSEKCMVLFYAPAWWLRIPVACTPFTWDDTLSFVRDKIGKKKAVQLPDSLRVASASSRRAARPKQPVLVPEVEEALDRLREADLAESRGRPPKEEPFFPEEDIPAEAPSLPPDEEAAAEQLTMDLGE